MRKLLWHIPWLVRVALIPVVVCGCGGDTTAPGAGDATQTFGALQLDQHAITLAVTPPHNTIHLHATPLSQARTPFPDNGTVQYNVAYGDTSVQVSSDGVITAKVPSYGTAVDQPSFVGSSAFVIASLTVHGITRADTAVVVVTATEPAAPLASLSIHPPAESLSVYASGHWLTKDATSVLNLIQLDSQGDTIPNQVVYFRTSNVNVAYPSSTFYVFGRAVTGIVANDTVTFFAQTWYYGAMRADSLQVRVGYPSSYGLFTYERTPLNSVTPELYWWPQSVEVTAPATVAFNNRSVTQPVDVVFDNPEDVQSAPEMAALVESFWGYMYPVTSPGNLAPFFWDSTGAGAAEAASGTSHVADSTYHWKAQYVWKRWRKFTKPGTYTYHTLFGTSGKIVVH